MQWYKTAGMLITAAAFGALGSLAAGDTPDPVFWTRWEPDGNAETHSHIIRMVTQSTHVYNEQEQEWQPANPSIAAADVVAKIRGTYQGDGVYGPYDEGEVCIFLSQLGQGHGDPDYHYEDGNWSEGAPALFKHWCDSLPDERNEETEEGGCLYDEEGPEPTEICELWWFTPWMYYGAEESDWDENGTGHWMLWFSFLLDVYLNPGDLDYDPLPVRFHFDSESPLCWNDDLAYAFYNCKESDFFERWTSEDIYGWDETMQYLWSIANQQGYGNVTGFDMDNPEEDDWDDLDNQPWVNWYMNIYRTTMDGAMKAACYDYVHTYWPSAGCSNFKTSCRIDGDHSYIPLWGWGANDWVDVHWEGVGDCQAPVLYLPKWPHLDTGDHEWDVTMEISRHNLDALIDSQTTYDPTEITPWIANIGQVFTVRTIWNGCEDCQDTFGEGESCSPPVATGLYCEEDDEIDDRVHWNYELTKNDTRELLSMCRSRQICEFIVCHWGGGTDEDDWDDLADVIDQVWMYDLDTCSIATGVNMNPQDCGDLEYAREGEYYTVNALDVGSTYKVELQVEFTTSEASPANRFLTLFEAKMAGAMVPPTVNVTAQAYNYYTSHWDGMVMRSPDNELGTDDTKLFIADNGYILPTDVYVAGGRAKIRLVFESETDDPFTVNVDSAMLAEKAPTP